MILCQKAIDGITFGIDLESAAKIAEWDLTVEYSEQVREEILGSANGNPSYSLIFLIRGNEVDLTIRLPHGYFSNRFTFECHETNNLSIRELTGCPTDMRNPREVVVGIRNYQYESLQKWKHWNQEDAFGGRYSYMFQENPFLWEDSMDVVTDGLSGESWEPEYIY